MLKKTKRGNKMIINQKSNTPSLILKKQKAKNKRQNEKR